MNANALLTTQIAASSLPPGKGLLDGANGFPQGLGNGLSFIDMIFAQTQAITTISQPHATDTSVVLAKKGKDAIEGDDDVLASLLTQLDTDTVDVLNAVIVDTPQPTALELQEGIGTDAPLLTQPEEDAAGNSPVPFAGLGSLRSYLDSLLQGLPQDQKPGQMISRTAEIKDGFKQFMASFHDNLVASKTEGDASLIATGLTPEDISELIAEIESTAALASQPTIALAPATATTEEQLAALLPRTLIAIQELAQKSQDTALLEETGQEEGDATTALNALVIGGTPDVSASPAPTKSSEVSVTPPPVIDTTSQLPGGVSEDANLEPAAGKGLENALEHINENMEKMAADGKKIPAGLQNAADKLQQKVGAGLSTITQPISGSIEAPSDWQNVFPEGMDPAQPYGATMKAASLTSATGLTSLVNHAPHASNPHPATQSVAATISKLASNGDDKAFTIKLDPPELGRVEIKMMIDKNNAVKAHLIIEKPETYMMLQRDAQILERSLQGIGLDAGDGGLSFELAQDGNMFRNEGEGGGERYQSGKNAGPHSEDSANAVMETTMTWHVDPDTGMQRYDILV